MRALKIGARAVVGLFLCASLKTFAATCTLEVPIVGPIGPGTQDVLERAESQAQKKGCASVLLLINTPGGSLDTTRTLVETILNSSRPVLCLVAPDGAHAASAGAVILQACHVNGALRGTHLGAATPILGTGESAPEDLRRKLINDMVSWMDTLTALRGRNAEFGRDIITKATSVSATAAQKLKAVDFVVDTKEEFLKLASQKEVKMSGGRLEKVEVGSLESFPLDVRFRVLSLLSDPQLAYMLFLGSLALLYFEFTHPGIFAPGVIGGLGLVLSLVALQKLNVEWGGLLLIVLGIGLLIAEMFVPSFGALGVGGMAAFILGSIFLFDPVKTGGYTLPLSTILITAVIFGSLFLGIGYLVVKTVRLRRRHGVAELVEEEAVVTRVDSSGKKGFVECRGEHWSFESAQELSVGAEVLVKDHKGLVLKVEKKSSSV